MPNLPIRVLQSLKKWSCSSTFSLSFCRNEERKKSATWSSMMDSGFRQSWSINDHCVLMVLVYSGELVWFDRHAPQTSLWPPPFFNLFDAMLARASFIAYIFTRVSLSMRIQQQGMRARACTRQAEISVSPSFIASFVPLPLGAGRGRGAGVRDDAAELSEFVITSALPRVAWGSRDSEWTEFFAELDKLKIQREWLAHV